MPEDLYNEGDLVVTRYPFNPKQQQIKKNTGARVEKLKIVHGAGGAAELWLELQLANGERLETAASLWMPLAKARLPTRVRILRAFERAAEAS